MPYKVVKSGDRWLIKREDTGEVVGRSDSRRKALMSVYHRLKGERKNAKNKK